MITERAERCAFSTLSPEIISGRILSHPTKHSPNVAQAQAVAGDVWCLVGLAELGFIVV